MTSAVHPAREVSAQPRQRWVRPAIKTVAPSSHPTLLMVTLAPRCCDPQDLPPLCEDSGFFPDC